jgi:nucleoid-associated protein YgaU
VVLAAVLVPSAAREKGPVPGGAQTGIAAPVSFAAPPADDSPTRLVPPVAYVRVRAGDSLWRIAEEALGDPRRWPEIWRANRGRRMVTGERFADADLIRPGWELRLPIS